MDIDVDDFATINSRAGRPGGDLVLRRVAQVLCQAVDTATTVGHAGAGDGLVGRVGGDEFAVLLSGVDADTTHSIATWVRQEIAGLRTVVRRAGVAPIIGSDLRVSIGAAIRSLKIDAYPTAVFTDLWWRADAALWQAKTSGKNTVRLST